MSMNLMSKLSCGGCGSTAELFVSTCKHLTLCANCGITMAENCAKCYECGDPIIRLIREYNFRVSSRSEKKHCIGRFAKGLPIFKKNENKWSMRKEGLQGRHVTDMLRERFKNRPWLLEDETGQFQYHGPLEEGSQSAIYYFLVLQGKDLVATPAGSWYNFNKVAQYKQLTLDEAEEKMKNRRKTADGYQRWMMKAANNGAAAFGEVEKLDDGETVTGGGRGRKKTSGNEDEANASDKGEEDEEEESSRKSRLGLKKTGDDDEGLRGGDLDFDDDDIEIGDDWEHEEIFTDDDEAVGNNPEERGDLVPEIPAPSIQQDDDEEDEDEDEDEDEGEEEEGGLSKSGKELKKLLGRANVKNDSVPEDNDDGDDDDDDDDDDDSEDDITPVLAPKKETPKEETVNNSSPLKSTAPATGRGTPSILKSSQGKRKGNGDESKSPNDTPLKKVRIHNDVKDEPSPSGPVTEDEIRAVLLQNTHVTTQNLVAKFKFRLRFKENKDAFTATMKRISKIQKTSDGASRLVLRKK